MRIKRIRVSNFRSIGDALDYVPSQGLNVLVGPNNAGKSSIFRALTTAIGANFQPSSFTQSHYRWRIERPEIRLEVAFSGDDHDKVIQVLLGGGLSERIGLGHPVPASELEEFKKIWPGVSLHLAPDQGTGFNENHSMGQFTMLRDGVLSGSGGDAINSVQLLRGATSSSGKQITSAERFINNVSKLVGDPVTSICSIVSNKLLLFSDVRGRPTKETPSGDSVDNSLDGFSTAGYLFHLKNSDPLSRKRYEAIQKEFSHLFRSLQFEAVKNGSSSKTVFNVVGHEDVDLDQDQVGTGVVELLTLVSNLVNKNDHIFVIEEPELHLHPQLQRALLRLILQTSDSNQVFVLTHSPLFIDSERLSSVSRVWMENGATRLSQFPTDLSEKETATLRENLRLPNAKELFFADAVLLVEGESEEAFFQNIAPRIDTGFDPFKLSIVSAGGQDSSKYKPYLRVLDKLGIPKLCQRDVGPGGVPPEWQGFFRYSGGELFDVLRAAGLQSLLNEAEQVVGPIQTHKPQVARYVGGNIPVAKIPPVFANILGEAFGLIERGR